MPTAPPPFHCPFPSRTHPKSELLECSAVSRTVSHGLYADESPLGRDPGVSPLGRDPGVLAVALALLHHAEAPQQTPQDAAGHATALRELQLRIEEYTPATHFYARSPPVRTLTEAAALSRSPRTDIASWGRTSEVRSPGA